MSLTQKIFHYIAGIFIAFPLASIADSRESLAREFVELLRYEDQFQESYKACLDSGRASTSPEILIKSNPGRFGGIQPNSRYWPQVVEAFEAHYLAICSKPTKDEFLDALATAYSAKLSVAQLQQALAFYRSDVGKEIIAAHKLASSSLDELFTKAAATHTPQAVAELERRVEEIINTSNAKPLKNAF